MLCRCICTCQLYVRFHVHTLFPPLVSSVFFLFFFKVPYLNCVYKLMDRLSRFSALKLLPLALIICFSWFTFILCNQIIHMFETFEDYLLLLWLKEEIPRLFNAIATCPHVHQSGWPLYIYHEETPPYVTTCLHTWTKTAESSRNNRLVSQSGEIRLFLYLLFLEL